MRFLFASWTARPLTRLGPAIWALACRFWCGQDLGFLPKNRYKHFHVRFSPAIHGLRNFWEGSPNPADQTCLQHARKNNAQRAPQHQVSTKACETLMSHSGRRLPKICGARDGGTEASHGCAEGAFFGMRLPLWLTPDSEGWAKENTNIKKRAAETPVQTAQYFAGCNQ